VRKPIQDQFTDLPVSRQRKYQLRMKASGRCSQCGAPATDGSRCLKHLVEARERQRALRGTKKRYDSASYRLEKEAKR
jgi:hypothetical protein